MKHLIYFLLISYSSISLAQSSVDDERLLVSLIERGVICEGLTSEQQQQALALYLQRKHHKEKSLNSTTHQEEACISPPKSD
ncbi:hypothetical protein [Vibrio anguillarum]|uniref:hypothetical protein n=1 Tax=Vibrio anguillarum TaxID=55601 RepID=UPI000BB4A57F|nr:hypothetical protein [Vibrio anguillarum]ATC59795.1 hypothetical protein CMV05_20660 [Vibrio anguillarum]MBF4252837.1 hypothetical protein [Vibrio anguillarum]MBF4386772.1 hypothetical protein [Vibrio anguillarum]MBF4402448.1 hypothetical protein [Vibrio anguillarum]